MNPSTNFHIERLRSYSSKQILFKRQMVPRFSKNNIQILSVKHPVQEKHWHVKSAIMGAFMFCLIGGVLMVFSIGGGGLPVLVFSCLFFGAGLLTFATSFLKSRKGIHA